MTHWAEWGTSIGTLVVAASTFAVRSRTARPGSPSARCLSVCVRCSQPPGLYVAGEDVGFWQAALRDPTTDLYAALDEAIRTSGRVTIDLLYGDHEGGQPTISRFVLLPAERDRWRCDVTRHWSLAQTEHGTGSS